MGPFDIKIRPVRQQIGKQRLLKSLRLSVPTTRVLNGFLQNLILEVPLQRIDGFSFYSDRRGQFRSPRSAKTRMGFCAQFHRKTLNIHHSRRRNEHSLPWVQQVASLFSRRYGKVHPRTAHEGPDVEWRYSSTLSLTSALDEGWVVNATPRPLYPRNDPVPIA